MLPGFRILFAAVVLSFSVLIFGLGAAALLRSAHEEFVGVPAWRAAQQMTPAMDRSQPTLSMLRVEPDRLSTAKFAPAKPIETKSVETKPVETKSDSAKIASVDKPATEKEIVAEKSADENIAKPEAKPRVRRAKRNRSAKTIRHWRARSPATQQQTTNSPFAGFGAADQTNLGGTSGNRRTVASTPF